MGFYIRKNFKQGPVRLNLSKSGIGVSAGVRGATLGVNAKGLPYVHAGRGGLYYRKNLSTGKRRDSRDPQTLYENAGAAYTSSAFTEQPGLQTTLPEIPEVPVGWGLFAVVAGLALLAFRPAAGTLLIAGGLLYFALGRYRNGLRTQLRTLLSEFASGGGADRLEAAESVARKTGVGERVRDVELRRAYLTVCRRIVDDGTVSEAELQQLKALEERIGSDPEFFRSARADAFRALYFTAVADHDLTEEEEATLRHIQVELQIDEGVIADKLETIEQLRQVRRIRDGELRPIQASVKLQNQEVCYFEAEGRLLKEKQLRSFTRDGRRHSVRGLVADKEGTLLITDKRILLMHSGTTTIRHGNILDIDLDMDEHVIRITKDKAGTPTILSTPRALEVYAILQALVSGATQTA